MRNHLVGALAAYSLGLTLVVGWFALLERSTERRSFGTLDVSRINVREPDGTLRMVISNRAQFPGIVFRNRDNPHASRTDSAGMIFLNDEGTENGGLIFGGRRTRGKVTSFGHLSFDQYEQDQVVALEQTEEGGGRTSGLTISDRPDTSIDLAAFDRINRLPTAERDAVVERLRAHGALGQRRLFLGKDGDRRSVVELRDGEGRPRLRMQVQRDGAAKIEFTDADGKVIRTIAP